MHEFHGHHSLRRLSPPISFSRTQEYLNHRGTKIRVFVEAKQGGIKGGGEEEKKDKRQGLKGKEGGRTREKGWEEMGPESALEKLRFWHPDDSGTL